MERMWQETRTEGKARSQHLENNFNSKAEAICVKDGGGEIIKVAFQHFSTVAEVMSGPGVVRPAGRSLCAPRET